MNTKTQIVSTQTMTKEQAVIELDKLQSYVVAKSEKDMSDIAHRMIEMGIPPEVVTAMQTMLSKTVDLTMGIAKQTYQIGKIIFLKIYEFIRKHPNLVLGIAMGAAVSAIVGALVGIIPFIGAWLAPLASAITAWIAIPVGAIAGHELDKWEQGQPLSKDVMTSAIEIAKEFWNLIVEIFIALKEHFAEQFKR